MAANPASRRALRYHQRRRARNIKLLTVLLVLIVVGVTATMVTLSRRESGKEKYVRRATAICDASADDIDEAASGLTAESTAEDVGAFLKDKYVPLLEERMTKLRALGFPGGDRETLEKLYDDTDEILETIKADPVAASGLGNPFTEIDTRFDTYGVVACGTRTPATGAGSSN